MDKRYYYKMDKRYYYKCGNNLLNLKAPLVNEPNVIEITEQEFNELSKPKESTAEQKALREKLRLISEKKQLLNKYREDIEQVDLFGMHRDDYDQKKQLCIQLVLELRKLERG